MPMYVSTDLFLPPSLLAALPPYDHFEQVPTKSVSGFGQKATNCHVQTTEKTYVLVYWDDSTLSCN